MCNNCAQVTHPCCVPFTIFLRIYLITKENITTLSASVPILSYTGSVECLFWCSSAVRFRADFLMLSRLFLVAGYKLVSVYIKRCSQDRMLPVVHTVLCREVGPFLCVCFVGETNSRVITTKPPAF